MLAKIQMLLSRLFYHFLPKACTKPENVHLFNCLPRQGPALTTLCGACTHPKAHTAPPFHGVNHPLTSVGQNPALDVYSTENLRVIH